MKTYTNTLKAQSTTKFNSKGEVVYQEPFSSGEDLNERDLELTELRSTSEYMYDDNLENFWSEEDASSMLTPKWISEELQYDSGDSFQIGNNVKGGI